MKKKPCYPPVLQKTGKGVFTSGDIKIESDFELCYYPENIRIKALLNHFGVEVDWKLNGILDDNRKICCDNLSKVKNDKIYYEFKPFENIIIGEKLFQNIQYAIFPLVGFYRGQADFSIDDFNIQIIGNQKVGEKNDYLSKIWKLQFEGLELKIQNNSASLNQYINIAKDITLLLSLSTGNEIMFHRQIYFYENGDKFEVWRSMVGYEFGVFPCVPVTETDQFLKQTLPEIQKWTEEDKKVLLVAINYINSSAKGYIEDRIFRLCQAWELLSDHWIKEKYELSLPLEDLKNVLKKTVKLWRKKYPGEDKEGFISDRIINSLYWGRLNYKIKKLIDSENLNEIKLGLDLKKLLEIRNNVAHSGRIKNSNSSISNLELLLSSQKGLQILLLCKLNYKGKVLSIKNKWETIEDISNFLNKNKS